MASNLLRNLDRVAGVAGNVFLGENERRQALLQEHLARSQKQGAQRQEQDFRTDLLRERMMYQKKIADDKLAENIRQSDKDYKFREKVHEDKMGLGRLELENMRKKRTADQKKQEKENFKEQLNSFRSNIDLLNEQLSIVTRNADKIKGPDKDVVNEILGKIEVEETARDLYRKSMGDKLKLNLYDDARRIIIEAEEKKQKLFNYFSQKKPWYEKGIGNTTYKLPKGTAADESFDKESRWRSTEY